MATYVGKWDCPACGTKRILGFKDGRTVERCPACGSPSTKKWYLDDREMVLSDPEEIKKAVSKRAWTCGHCDHLNDADDQECDACGNPKDLSTDDVQLVQRRYEGTNAPKNTKEVADLLEEGVTDQAAGMVDAELKTETLHPDDVPKKPSRFKMIAILSGTGALVLFLIISLFLRTETQVEVASFSWERTVSIEDFGPRSYSSWNPPPADAYNTSSAQEVHHYDRIYEGQECHTETYSYVCGTIDNGNGTFSDQYCDETREVCEDKYREEPVYATKYYYDIDEWAHHHNVESKGDDKHPEWPTDPKTSSSPGKWRNGARSGEYFVHLKDDGGTLHQEDISETLWNDTEQGNEVTGYKNQIWGFWMGLKNDGK